MYDALTKDFYSLGNETSQGFSWELKVLQGVVEMSQGLSWEVLQAVVAVYSASLCLPSSLGSCLAHQTLNEYSDPECLISDDGSGAKQSLGDKNSSQ